MKLNQHYAYEDIEVALTRMTEAYFKTGDIMIKKFRDDLEYYITATEIDPPVNDGEVVHIEGERGEDNI